MTAVVEFEYFHGIGGTLVIKELAYYDIQTGYHGQWCFRPPYPLEELPKAQQSHVAWAADLWHGLPWNSGRIPYRRLDALVENVCLDYDQIFTKGSEKVSFLKEKLLQPVFDLDAWHCPRIDPDFWPTVRCRVHEDNDLRCALAKAECYAQFLKKAKTRKNGRSSEPPWDPVN